MRLVQKHKEKLFQCFVGVEIRLRSLNMKISDEEINIINKYYLFRNLALKSGCVDTVV